jgi:hypothetical protein
LDNWRNNNPIDSYIANRVSALNLPADTPLEVTFTNKVGQRHAIGLIILRMFADTLPERDWEHAAKYWIPALFDADLAKAAGALVRTNEEFGDVATTLQQALAYSALDEGERPFGDTGIHALFNDANELGKALKAPDVSQIIRDNAGALAQMLVQYAGKLVRYWGARLWSKRCWSCYRALQILKLQLKRLSGWCWRRATLAAQLMSAGHKPPRQPLR